MPASRLPIDVKNFLNDVIDSVTHLEVLLILFSHPDKSFTADAISKELRTNERSAEVQLLHLSEKGLLSKNEKNYQYKPNTEELHEKVKLTYDLYKERPVSVIAGIFEKPQDKLRNFSDAFRLKKD